MTGNCFLSRRLVHPTMSMSLLRVSFHLVWSLGRLFFLVTLHVLLCPSYSMSRPFQLIFCYCFECSYQSCCSSDTSRAGAEHERQKQTDMEPTIPNPLLCQYMFNVTASFTTNQSCTHNKREALPNSVQYRTKLMRCAARKHQFIDINLFRTQRFSLCVIGIFSGCSVQRFLAT